MSTQLSPHHLKTLSTCFLFKNVDEILMEQLCTCLLYTSLRKRRHTARQNGPNHYPWGFKGPQPLGTPFSPIFRRATKDGATGGRQLPNAAGKNAKQNDYSPGGPPTENTIPVKTQNKKPRPPEGLPIGGKIPCLPSPPKNSSSASPSALP